MMFLGENMSIRLLCSGMTFISYDGNKFRTQRYMRCTVCPTFCDFGFQSVALLWQTHIIRHGFLHLSKQMQPPTTATVYCPILFYPESVSSAPVHPTSVHWCSDDMVYFVCFCLFLDNTIFADITCSSTI